MDELEKIGPYALIAPLGLGAGSRVWLAQARQGGPPVALKLPRPDDPGARARLRHEARIAAPLVHPNIVRIHHYGEASGLAWLVMDHVAGQASASAPAPAQALSLALFRQLLLALAYLHQRAIVHCDVKPANLLVGPNGQLKLADFGLARRFGQGGAAIGTPSFMAPEQLRGQVLDGRADVFSAGVVLYQILTGKRPFQGSAFEVMQQILQGAPLAPPPLCDFDTVIQTALARDPEQRFASAEAFLHAFDRACHRLAPPVA
jgi:serine/threonine-protein kinase